MDIKNIAIVRATNVIPFDGIVYPLSEVPYLQKEHGTEFSFAMNDLLKRQNKLKQIDWTKLDEMDKISEENKEILKQYLPYNSDYNSVVLWSLNGLVPDDMNNTFSNKTCAIIDGLEEQIEESEMISLVPTDTAIKAKDGQKGIKLSQNATILISKERYETLSQEEKNKLDELDLKVSVFEGELQQAVNQNLEESGRFTAEKLSLNRVDGGYIQSDTSDEIKQTIGSIAKENNIAQELFFNIITGQSDELDKLHNVKDIYENMMQVSEFYKKTFFNYMFSKMDISEDVKINSLFGMDSSVYMNELCDEIERIGIDKYKEVLDGYNARLEELQKSGELPTPQQIIDSINRGEPINLQDLIEKRDFEHSADGDLKEIAIGENIKNQNDIVLETKKGVTQEQEQQKTGDEK